MLSVAKLGFGSRASDTPIGELLIVNYKNIFSGIKADNKSFLDSKYNQLEYRVVILLSLAEIDIKIMAQFRFGTTQFKHAECVTKNIHVWIKVVL